MIDLRTIVTILLSAYLCSSVGIFSAYGEHLDIEGISFPVEALARVDENSIKVSAFGELRIIAKDRLEGFVVDKGFSNKLFLATLESDSLAEFIKGALRDGKTDLVARGLLALISLSHKDEDLISLIDVVASDPKGIQALAGIVQMEDLPISGNVRGALLLGLARFDIRWLRERGAREFYGYVDTFKRYSEIKTLGFLERGDIEGARQITEILQEALGEDDELSRRLTVLIARAVDSVRLRRASGVEAILPLIEVSRYNKEYERALSPLISDGLKTVADVAISEGQFDKALQILASRGKPWIVPYESVIRALDGVGATGGTARFGGQVRDLLQVLSLKNREINDRYSIMVGYDIEELLDRGEIHQAYTIFQTLLKFNPDPDPLNDRLRVSFAIVLSKRGDIQHADQFLAHMRGSISIFQYARLFWAGLYFEFEWIFIAIFSPLLAGYITVKFPSFSLLKFLGITGLLEKREKSSSKTIRSEEEPGKRWNKLRASDLSPDNPWAAEYHACLKKLGVKVDASLAEIKGAYRNAAKAAHPDVTHESEAKASDVFISVTEAYNRILELRKKLRLEDE